MIPGVAITLYPTSDDSNIREQKRIRFDHVGVKMIGERIVRKAEKLDIE